MNDISKNQEELWQNRKTAEHYWKTGIKRSAWFAKELDAFMFSSVFEVGCNSGRNLKYIVDRFPSVRFGGLDINTEAIGFAREQMPAGNFETGSVYDLDTSDKYDLIFTCGTMIHIPGKRFISVAERMMSKSNKYLIHLEQIGANTILNAPKEFNPTVKIKNKFRWAPDLIGTYVGLGIDRNKITKHKIRTDLVSSDCTHMVVVEL